MRRSHIILWLILMFAIAASAAAPGYHLMKTYKLGGDGGWDYLTLDPSSRRLYISRGTHVIVLNADSGKVVGDIPDTPGVHGIALATDLGKGFVSNGREGTASVFDISNLKLITKVKVGDNPDAILYDPASKRIFTFNGKSHDASVIDADKSVVAGTIKLDGKPEFGVSDSPGHHDHVILAPPAPTPTAGTGMPVFGGERPPLAAAPLTPGANKLAAVEMRVLVIPADGNEPEPRRDQGRPREHGRAIHSADRDPDAAHRVDAVGRQRARLLPGRHLDDQQPHLLARRRHDLAQRLHRRRVANTVGVRSVLQRPPGDVVHGRLGWPGDARPERPGRHRRYHQHAADGDPHDGRARGVVVPQSEHQPLTIGNAWVYESTITEPGTTRP